MSNLTAAPGNRPRQAGASLLTDVDDSVVKPVHVSGPLIPCVDR